MAFRRESVLRGTLASVFATRKLAFLAGLVAVAIVSGCGGSSTSSTSAPAASGSAANSGAGAGALAADARSAATGDIPDNQVFLVFQSQAGGYSIKYPEGWTQSAVARDVQFRDKNNVVHIHVAQRPEPTPATVAAQLKALKRSNPTLTFRTPEPVSVGTNHAIKTVYTTQSAPNAVTGKRVMLIVDRYELSGRGRVATVDLATPQGVDNVDAYRLMIESFRWR